jgi:HWE histidine kinase
MPRSSRLRRRWSTTIDRIRRHQETLGKHAEHTRFLMREVLQRAKNQLTIIQSILRQTLGRASNAEEFQVSFVERLQGLAETQNLLVKEAWEGAPIDQSALEGEVEVNYGKDGFCWRLSGSTAYFVQKSREPGTAQKKRVDDPQPHACAPRALQRCRGRG